AKELAVHTNTRDFCGLSVPYSQRIYPYTAYDALGDSTAFLGVMVGGNEVVRGVGNCLRLKTGYSCVNIL
ncbi:hypothetical protein, partial [Clostridium perfringens]